MNVWGLAEFVGLDGWDGMIVVVVVVVVVVAE